VETLTEAPPVSDVADIASETSYVARLARELRSTTDRGVEYESLHGKDAAKAIVAYAGERGAAVVLVATHGRTGLARLAAGSVAMGVVRRSPCPVLVYRPANLRG
jgi:nucleotide-binding universal stress UspA family protein